ncbi:MAG: tetratricopeptide repeat protein [Methanomassiliicoccales archaeon]|nr:tetratricopeptide repeat protein [Methanomassiliicoccales archaeon]
MTDLAEKLDQSERQRLVAAIRALNDADYRDLMISLLGGIGVRVQSAKEQQGILIIYGQGEEGYLVLASRMEFSDPELIVRSLIEDAANMGRTPVFMALQQLDPGTLNLLEKEEISYADMDKFLVLLQKYGLDQQLQAKEDLKVLEDRGESCLPSVGKLEALVEEADERKAKGDLAGAVKALGLALEIKPLYDTLWQKKASILLEMGRASDALASATRAAELRPGDAGTWFVIALIQNRLDDKEKELTAYDNVLRINPAHSPALLNKGATLYEMGRYEWALKVFNDMVQRYPKEPRGWNNRGLVLKSMNRQSEAQASFEKSSVLDRNFADPLINIALLLEDKGALAEAVDVWKDVLRLVDSRADIWAHLGSCLRDLGENEDALTALDRSLYLDPSQEMVRQERAALAELMHIDSLEETSADGRTLSEAVQQGCVEEAEAPTSEEGPDGTMEEAAVLPATVPEEVALQEIEEPGELQTVPEPSLPVEVKEGTTSLVVPDEPGELQNIPGPSLPVEVKEEAKALEVLSAPGKLQVTEEAITPPVVPMPAEVFEDAPRKRHVWPFEIALPALPSEREDRALQEASLLLAGGEREKAVHLIELALKELPHPELLRLKARALIVMGRNEEAADSLKEALRHAPQDVRTILDLEALFHRYGGEGSRLLKSAMDCDEARSRQALEMLEDREYSELSRLDIKGAPVTVRHAKALALMRMSRYRDASKLLKLILTEFPAFPEALNSMGVCMRFMGEYDYDQAIHMMELAMEVDPHYSDAMNNIGCTLMASGDYVRSKEVFKAAVDEDKRPEYLLNLSNLYMVMGDVEAAKGCLTSALKIEEEADVLYMLGVIAEGEKQYRWAFSLYQDALERSPGFREAQGGLDRTRVPAKK